MSKRNTILFIIVLIILTTGVLWYFYFNKSTDTINTNTKTEGENFVSNFFNFGKIKTKEVEDDSTSVTDISEENEETTIDIQEGNLFKISSMPVAGFTVFMKERFKEIANPKEIEQNNLKANLEVLPPSEKKVTPIAPLTEFVPALRYVDKATGNIYQTFTDQINERKFSNMEIEGIYEAYFGNNGNTVISRYLKSSPLLSGETIITYSGSLPKEILGNDSVVENNISGSFLPENIIDMSISPNTTKMFYLFNWKEGVVGTTAFSNGDNKKQIFDSKYTEWLTQWPNENTITITTKSTSFVPGFMYIINPNNSSIGLKRILGGIRGLTTLTSPNGKLVLYSNDTVSLNIYDIETGEAQTLGVKSLPEKCVWGISSDVIYCAVPKLIDNSFSYPDSWYRGEVSFSDDIWRIDVSQGNAKIIFNSEEEIDGVRLMLDQNEDFLFFINKKDSYLWGLTLE